MLGGVGVKGPGVVAYLALVPCISCLVELGEG